MSTSWCNTQTKMNTLRDAEARIILQTSCLVTEASCNWPHIEWALCEIIGLKKLIKTERISVIVGGWEPESAVGSDSWWLQISLWWNLVNDAVLEIFGIRLQWLLHNFLKRWIHQTVPFKWEFLFVYSLVRIDFSNDFKITVESSVYQVSLFHTLPSEGL